MELARQEQKTTIVQKTDASQEMEKAFELKGSATTVSAVQGPIRRKRRLKGQETCGVCGDQAKSHNFGALSCETCKAFFRRNALRTTNIQPCAFDNKCEIDKTTRRFCAECRLKKCFQIGMDPELILDEKERKSRKTHHSHKNRSCKAEIIGGHLGSVLATAKTVSLTCNRNAKFAGNSSSADVSTSLNSLITITVEDVNYRPSNVGQDKKYHCDSNIIAPASTTASIPDLSLPTSTLYNYSQSHLNSGHPSPEKIAPNSCDLPDKTDKDWLQRFLSGFQLEARGDEKKTPRDFRHVTHEELPWELHLYWRLTDDERCMLIRLTSEYENSFLPMSQYAPSFPVDQGVSLESILQALDNVLHRCVQYAKKIPEFRQLYQPDQISTLKASFLQIYAIRCSAFFMPEHGSWSNLSSNITISDVMVAFNHQPMVVEFIEYCTALKNLVKNDGTLYALLICIAFFDPSVVDTAAQAFVRMARAKYLTLLQHYLESRFSFLHADRYLRELKARLAEVREVGHRLLEFYGRFSSLFHPLVAEFFSQ